MVAATPKRCARAPLTSIAVVSSTGSARSFKDFRAGGAQYHCVLGCDVTRLSTKHAKHNNMMHMHHASGMVHARVGQIVTLH